MAEGGKERNEEERERKRKIRAVEGEGRTLSATRNREGKEYCSFSGHYRAYLVLEARDQRVRPFPGLLRAHLPSEAH